jgi:hypothetical protein
MKKTTSTGVYKKGGRGTRHNPAHEPSQKRVCAPFLRSEHPIEKELRPRNSRMARIPNAPSGADFMYVRRKTVATENFEYLENGLCFPCEAYIAAKVHRTGTLEARFA